MDEMHVDWMSLMAAGRGSLGATDSGCLASCGGRNAPGHKVLEPLPKSEALLLLGILQLTGLQTSTQ